MVYLCASACVHVCACTCLCVYSAYHVYSMMWCFGMLITLNLNLRLVYQLTGIVQKCLRFQDGSIEDASQKFSIILGLVKQIRKGVSLFGVGVRAKNHERSDQNEGISQYTVRSHSDLQIFGTAETYGNTSIANVPNKNQAVSQFSCRNPSVSVYLAVPVSMFVSMSVSVSASVSVSVSVSKSMSVSVFETVSVSVSCLSLCLCLCLSLSLSDPVFIVCVRESVCSYSCECLYD